MAAKEMPMTSGMHFQNSHMPVACKMLKHLIELHHRSVGTNAPVHSLVHPRPVVAEPHVVELQQRGRIAHMPMVLFEKRERRVKSMDLTAFGDQGILKLPVVADTDGKG